MRVADDDGSIRVVFKGSAPDGLDEIRGEFWDIGRMKPDDIRLSTLRSARKRFRSIRMARGHGPGK